MMMKGTQNLGALVVGSVYFSIVHGEYAGCSVSFYYGRRSRSSCDVVCCCCDAQREESPHIEPWPMTMRDTDPQRCQRSCGVRLTRCGYADVSMLVCMHNYALRPAALSENDLFTSTGAPMIIFHRHSQWHRHPPLRRHSSTTVVLKNDHSKPIPKLSPTAFWRMAPNTSFRTAALASTAAMEQGPPLADSQRSISRGSLSP
jgi:hypothetical protein